MKMLKRFIVSLIIVIASVSMFGISNVYAEEDDWYSIEFYSAEGNICTGENINIKSYTEEIRKGDKIGGVCTEYGEPVKHLVGWISSVDGIMYSSYEVREMIPTSDMRFEAVWKERTIDVLYFYSKEGYIKGDPSLKRDYVFVKKSQDHTKILKEYMPHGREGYYCLGFGLSDDANKAKDVYVIHHQEDEFIHASDYDNYFAVWTKGNDGGDCTIKLSKTKFYYDGKTHKPKVTIKYKGKKLAKSYYKVEYEDSSIETGHYEMFIVFKNGYHGKFKRTYLINNKIAEFRLIGHDKSFGFTPPVLYSGDKIDHDQMGYIIQYSTTKKFTKKKTKTVKITYKKYRKLMRINNTKGVLSFVKTIAPNVASMDRYFLVEKLKSHKKYYVRIRVYEKPSNEKNILYSDWTKVKTVKTK